MKVRTSDLIGPALDWAVALALGLKFAGSYGPGVVRFDAVWKKEVAQDDVAFLTKTHYVLEKSFRDWNKKCDGELSGVPLWLPSSSWHLGGPILDKLMDAGLQLIRTDWSEPENKCRVSLDRPSGFYYGPTVLIATMRCYVASVLGAEVDIPKELL